MKKEGPVHALPTDMQLSLDSHPDSLAAWHRVTLLAQNEWICWVESAKGIETRDRRITRAMNELADGKRRPCCWPGCIHRVTISD